MNHNQRWRHKVDFCQTVQRIVLEHGLLDDLHLPVTAGVPHHCSHRDREHVATSPAVSLKSTSPPRVRTVEYPNALESSSLAPAGLCQPEEPALAGKGSLGTRKPTAEGSTLRLG
jgi:hypothetical protein